jgi:hypothetical protein
MSVDFTIVFNDQPSTMAEICGRYSVPYAKGSCYYLLEKKENVSTSKELFAYHTSGEYNSSPSDIRAKFSLSGANIAPCDIPDGWELYIQSTSPNRKIPAKTKVLIRGSALPIPPATLLSSSSSNSSSEVPKAVVSKPTTTTKTAAAAPKKTPVAAAAAEPPTSTPMLQHKPPAKSSPTAEEKKRKADEPSSQGTKVAKSTPSLANTASLVAACKPAVVGGWMDVQGSISVKDYGSPNSNVIAGFDMDWTLIRTKSGKTFAQSADDWELWCPEVPARLQQAHQQGFLKIIFIIYLLI